MKTSLVFAVLLIVWMAWLIWQYGGEWLLKGGG
jgi:hypothetical protein